jgi:hypothetical protein
LLIGLTLRFFFFGRYARKYAQSFQVPLQFRSSIGEPSFDMPQTGPVVVSYNPAVLPRSDPES